MDWLEAKCRTSKCAPYSERFSGGHIWRRYFWFTSKIQVCAGCGLVALKDRDDDLNFVVHMPVGEIVGYGNISTHDTIYTHRYN